MSFAPPLRRPPASWQKTGPIFLIGGGILVLWVSQAAAQSPTNGRVIAGTATISQNSTRSTITQTTNRAIIRWSGFDVGPNHTVVFDQPGKSSATLNRVISARGSVIEGAINAPGTVIIQNSAGVLFTPTAKVDTGGLVATSQWVDADPFMTTGSITMGAESDIIAQVRNQGEITVRDAGLAALVGSRVENSGVILADRGTVALASGRRTTIDLSGDGTFRVAVIGNAVGGGTINHSGTIDVGAGQVVISAGNAAQALDNVINTTGVIRASSGTGDGGRIHLSGQGTGRVRIASTLDASGSGRGGEISITGAKVHIVSGASVMANGASGGTIRVGGVVGGIDTTRHAESLILDRGSHVSATGSLGDGGTFVGGSSTDAVFDGGLDVRGVTSGGRVETLTLGALAVGDNASITLGQGGSWRLGSADTVIADGAVARDGSGAVLAPSLATPYRVHRQAVAGALNAGADVRVEALNDLSLGDSLTWNTAADLDLIAARDIGIRAGITAYGAGDIRANAGRDFLSGAPILSEGEGNVTIVAGRTLRFDQSITGGAGNVALTSTSADIAAGGTTGSDVQVSTISGKLLMEATTGSILLSRADGVRSDLRVLTGTGDISLRAGSRIVAQGGAADGAAVRIGGSGPGATVSLTAAEVSVAGGAGSGSGAEVIAGGALSIRGRDAITVQDHATGSGARVAALGGASLDLRADRQTWNGAVASGSGASDGGSVTIAGAITAGRAPTLSLKSGEDFTFLTRAPNGASSSYLSGAGLSVATLGAGRISIDAPTQARALSLTSQARVSLGTAASLRGTGPGDALVVAAGAHFDNAAGADVLGATDPLGRWLLYMDNFNALSGAAPASGTFDLYGRSYASTPPVMLAGFSGNRTVYGETPVLTLTAGSGQRTYGGALLTLGYGIAGLRDGDSVATALTGAPVVSSAGNVTDANAGQYTTSIAATASAQGYRLEFETGDLTVGRAGLTITPTGSRTYGAAQGNYSVTFDGLVAGDTAGDLDGAARYRTSATRASDVGDYALNVGGFSSQNYAITYAPGTLRIDKAALRVSVKDSGRVYGAANPTFGLGYEGFVLGQDATVLGGTPQFATAATSASDVGSYQVGVSGLTSGNYAISYAPGTLRVGKAALRVTVADSRRTYGADNPGFTIGYDGFVLGQDASVLGGSPRYSTAAGSASDVGTYRVTASGLTSGNYAISYDPGSLRVEKAALRVSVKDSGRTYGANNPAFGASFDGFVLGQDASVLGGSPKFTTTATAASDVGTYRVAASGLTSRNYAISYDPGTLRVEKAALRVSVKDTRRTYGSDNPGFSVGYDGFVLGQDASVLGGSPQFTTTATAASDVGNYRVAASGLTSGNYDISYRAGSLRVARANLTVKANDATRLVGAPDPAFTARFEGFVLGQDSSILGGALNIETRAEANSPAGRYDLSPGGFRSSNYNISYVPGQLTITQPVFGPTTPINSVTQAFATGVAPNTPGDAGFRTTKAEAGPAEGNVFEQSFSLGEIAQLSSPGASGNPSGGFVPAAGEAREEDKTAEGETEIAASQNQGFVPASGLSGEPERIAAPDQDLGTGASDCIGAVNTGATSGCVLRKSPESFWSISGGVF